MAKLTNILTDLVRRLENRYNEFRSQQREPEFIAWVSLFDEICGESNRKRPLEQKLFELLKDLGCILKIIIKEERNLPITQYISKEKKIVWGDIDSMKKPSIKKELSDLHRYFSNVLAWWFALLNTYIDMLRKEEGLGIF